MSPNPYESPSAASEKSETSERIQKEIHRQIALNIGLIMSLGVTEIVLLLGHIKQKITLEQLETYGILAVIGFGTVGAINSILMFRNLRKYSSMKKNL
ncbi:MAG: hypothetical protein AAB489_05785 [Patescibacteria group bacterium]